MSKKALLQDLEANKRNHKIQITDIAISKVPFVKYREIPEEHYPILQTLAKSLLEAARDENECNETSITYNLDSVKMLKEESNRFLSLSYGDEHSVNPMANTEANHILATANACTVVILHNHPNLSKISLQDISYLLKYQALKMIIAVTNIGTINYVVKTNKYDREKALSLLIEAIQIDTKATSLKEHQTAAEFFLKNCFTAGIIFDNHERR